MDTGGYKNLSQAHLDVARHFSSPSLIGPPLCDELVALVEHMFTEEEAEVVRHLPPMKFRSAERLARKSGMTLEEVNKILRVLAEEKYILLSFKARGKNLYGLIPIVPGTFEAVLVRTSVDSVTPWHKRFAELYEELFNTGFTTHYFDKKKKSLETVRYLPVGEAIEGDQMAFPSDKLEEVLEPYDDFAVGICQCRLSKDLVDGSCGKKLETCVVMGKPAPGLIAEGRMRAVSRQEVIDIKREAESEGLVTWMMNVESKLFNISCSCCGCCCGALRTVSQFNTPGFIAPPHFMPDVSVFTCKGCSRCVKACPMKALTILKDEKASNVVLDEKRCIGCGLCSLACKEGILKMKAVKDYRKPKGIFGYIAKFGPRFLNNSIKILGERK